MRNADRFAYNRRGEVASATVAEMPSAYAYDGIGNFTSVIDGAVTNTYSANELNQYEEVTDSSGTVEPTYTSNGELASFGSWTYAYDALSRLVAAYSNGTLVVSNRYDHIGRRVQKIAPDGTHTFLYDGWRPVVETVATPSGGTDRIEYHWGKDLSGALDGAAGVGGLLYVKRNGVIYVPFYDAYGNVMEYRAADGSLAAAYVYDAFGRTIAQAGPLADAFRFRYSTKSYECESGLYYYGKRFYSPELRRWLSRDPLGERGGVNLYAFCRNNALSFFDKDGQAYFAVRPLGSSPTILRWSDFFTCPFMKVAADVVADYLNVEILHEQLFFEDRNSDCWSIGWGQDDNGRGTYLDNELKFGYTKRDGGYNDCVMRIAVAEVNPNHYQLLWFTGFKSKCNCQDYAQALRDKYKELIADECIRCKCNLKQ